MQKIADPDLVAFLNEQSEIANYGGIIGKEMKVTPTLFAEFPPINVIPGFDRPIVIAEVAPQYCATCGITETPIFDSSWGNESWHMVCHEYKCVLCEAWGHTDDGIWQSGVGQVCEDCYVPRDNDDYDSGCNCVSCREDRGERDSRYMMPAWDTDGRTLSKRYAGLMDQVTTLITSETDHVNPAAMMAEFYVSDYVLARIQMTYRHGLSASNVGHAAAYKLRADAKRIQDNVVSTCDGIFRDYLLMACGGELRHHRGVSMPSGRSSSWEWFVAMSHEYGRDYMIGAACELFEDHRGWDSGYGGAKWAEIARILEARELGKIDARTFVDRVFTLQHNGGSCLDKVEWGKLADKSHYDLYVSTARMVSIGNAHAADIPDFEFLFQFCRSFVIRDLLFDEDGYCRMLTSGMPVKERQAWNLAIDQVAKALLLDWTNPEELRECSGTYDQYGEYVMHDGKPCPFHPGDGYHYRRYLPQNKYGLKWFNS